MSFLEKSDKELIDLAVTSSEKKVLSLLVNSQNMNVRRALTRNKNIDSFVANKLLFDPVLNVSYMASLNPNTTQKRDFSSTIITACVKCEIDERKLDCINCPHLKSLL